MKMSLQWRFLAVTWAVGIFLALSISSAYYQAHRSYYLSGIDAQLSTAAHMARHFLGADFHDQLFDAQSLDAEAYARIVDHHNLASMDTGLQYLWSNLFLPDGRIVFTTATSPGKDIAIGDHAAFFSEHSDPSAFDAVRSSDGPVFSTFQNEWGEGRMGLFPYRDTHGRLYVLGASMELDPIDQYLGAQFGWALIMFATFFLLATIIAVRASRSMIAPLQQLQHTTEAIANGDYVTPRVAGGGEEIEALSDSIARMRDTIQSTLKRHEESEARFRTIFDQSPVAIVIHDRRDGSVINANRSAWEAYGYKSMEEFQGANMWLESPYSKQEALAWIAGTSSDEPQFFEWKSKRLDGNFFWEQVCLRPVVLDGVDCVLAVAVDITERKQAQESLSAQRSLLHALITTLPDLVWMKDPDGVYLSCNKRFEQFFGAAEAEILGKTDFDFMNATMAEAFRMHDRYAIEKGSPSVNEEEIVFACDGHREILETIKTPLHDDNGNLVGVLGIGRDITERKQSQLELEQHRHHLSELVQTRTEELARAKDEAEAASRAKSAFLANMSHEIRTPLNAVIGFAQILSRDSSLLPRQTEQVSTIARSGQHLLGLINDILDLSKIESGRLKLNPQDFDLHVLLGDLTRMFALRAEAKGLQLTLERQPGLPARVHGDEGKLRQVLINLLGNAIKFTHQGSVSLRVRACTEHATEAVNSALQPPLLLRFEVQDTGPGMTESELAQLFTPFQQAEAGRRSGAGTGLGLSISKKLLGLMSGGMEVHSQPSVGSCFNFWLPLHPARAPLSAEVVQQPELESWRLPPGVAVPRLLVVDDLSANRRLLADVLQPVGFEVVEAVNGADAVAEFERQPADLVLMDMRMPVMDGYEATRRIKALSQRTPVIAVTASALEDDRQGILDCGVDALLGKPVEREQLMRTLWRCLALPLPDVEEVPEHEPQVALTRERVQAAVTPAQLAQLHEALTQGDMIAFDETLMCATNMACDLREALKRLADLFEYDQLHALLSITDEQGKS